MKTKLTLNIDDGVIEEIKIFSKKRKQSISAIVEEYLRTLTSAKSKHPAKTETFTQRFRRTFPSPPSQSIENLNYKDEWHKHLEEKYGDK